MRISDWSSDVCSSDLEVLVVLVERPADAVVRQPEVLDAGGPVALGGVLEGLVRRHADAFQHTSQHGAGMQVVLVRDDTDGDLARAEERRVGKECVSTCNSRLSQAP